MNVMTTPEIAATPVESAFPVASFHTPTMSRRSLVLGLFGVATATALNMVGMLPLPFLKLNKAFGASYTYWPTCAGWFDESGYGQICTPWNSYFGGDNCDYIPGYDPHGYWHKGNYWTWNGSVWKYWGHDPTSCSDHNAWTWTNAPNYRSYGYNWQCSDGYYAVWQQFGTFSICRSGWL
jgi:hypothetical protein